jgi:hypothetical protein
VCPVFTADVSGLSSFDCLFCLRSVSCVSVSSVYCWCLWIVQCLLLISLDCTVLTADVSGLSSFDCLFCLRSVSCVSVSIVYCWCLWIVQFLLPLLPSSCILCECVQCLLLRTKTEEAIKTGQSRDISSEHWTHSHKIQNEDRRGNQNWTIQRHQQWTLDTLTQDTERRQKRQSKLDNLETSAVNTGHTHTRYRTKTEEAIKTGQSRDISSKHWTIQRYQQ